MKSVTYYARFGYCDDGICVNFPDVHGAYTCGNTKAEAITMAEDVLKLCLDSEEMYVNDIFLPSHLEDLEAESNWVLEEYENSFEFVPITVTLTTEVYQAKIKPHQRLKN